MINHNLIRVFQRISSDIYASDFYFAIRVIPLCINIMFLFTSSSVWSWCYKADYLIEEIKQLIRREFIERDVEILQSYQPLLDQVQVPVDQTASG